MDVSRSDVRLYGQALRERWPISDDKRAKLIEILFQVAGDGTGDPRARVSAAKVLVDMDKLNAQPAGPRAVHQHLHITSRETDDIEERRRILIEKAARIGNDA